MNKFSKMAALLMSAVMCAFTSCGGSDDEKNDVATAPVAKVALMATPEALDIVEGTLKLEFKPSGKTQTLNLSAATGPIDQKWIEVVEGGEITIDLSDFKAKAGSVTGELTGSLNDTECVITPSVKPKAGLDLSADKTYSFRIFAPCLVYDGKSAVHKHLVSISGITGDKLQQYCEANSKPHTISLK